MKLRRVVSFIIAAAILLSMIPAVSLPTSAATDESADTATETITNTATGDAADAATEGAANDATELADTAIESATRAPTGATRAASGTTGECTWSLNGTELTISGKGAMDSTQPWGTNITKVIIEQGVTNIATGAFTNSSSLTHISIADSMTEIGFAAFSNCSSLKEITLPDGIVSIGGEAFYGCSSLSAIKIPKGVTNIDRYTFYNCSSLAEVTFPNGLIGIGECAFYGCSSLTAVNIPDGVLDIGWYAFNGCSNLTDISIPDSVTNVGGYAFDNCTSLTYDTYDNAKYLGNADNPHVILVDTVSTSIDSCQIHKNTKIICSYAFASCAQLPGITIPEGVVSIGSYAFSKCTSLTGITVPDSVASIGQAAFTGCKSIETITVPFVGGSAKKATDTYQYPLGYIFGTSSYTGGTSTKQNYVGSILSSTTSATYYIPTGLKSVTVTGGVIVRGAFENCTNLTNIHLGDHVTEIKSRAYGICTGLTDITVPDSVVSIDKDAFYGCSNLKSITIPFIGVCRNPSTEEFQYPLGYIFGGGGMAITQNFYGPNLTNYSTTYSIPASLKSVTVTDGDITYGAFSNWTNLTHVTIGDGVQKIAGKAFYGCTNLKSVSIPDSILEISSDAFSQCNSQIFNLYSNGYYLGNANNRYLALIKSVSTDITYCRINDNTKIIADNAFRSNKKLTSVIFGNQLYKIGNHAFYGCAALTDISLPDSLGVIGKYAFFSCDGLTEITIPTNVTEVGSNAFYGCDNLACVKTLSLDKWLKIAFGDEWANPMHCANTLYVNGNVLSGEIVIPDTVTCIASNAFKNCTQITHITVPKSVLTIEKGAFSGCSGLQSITIPFVGQNRETAYPFGYIFGDTYYAGSTLTEQKYYDSESALNSGTYSIPNSLRTVTVLDGEIRYGAFGNCSALTDITIPSDITSIGGNAFYNCSGLTDMKLPDSVTEIGEFSYYGCKALTSVTISNRVTSIGSSAFGFCSNLKEVSLGNGITDIADYTFSGCEKLTQVTMGANVSHFGTGAFHNCAQLTDITIPGCLDSIGDDAFYNCKKLNYRTYNNGLYLGNSENPYMVLADTVSTDILSFQIPEDTKIILGKAFENCTSLVEVVIGENVINIGRGAFAGCGNLTSITLPFVGVSRKTAADTYQYPLGYIFGSSSYTGGTAVKQYYYASSPSSLTSSTYYIPAKLNAVTVLGGEVLYGAFYNCTSITAVTIGNHVTSVSKDAFEGCDSLERIEVAKDNPYYAGVNGILYNKDKTEQIFVPKSHRLLFQVNYTYAGRETAVETVTQWKIAGEAYSAAVPEIPGYSTKIVEISGTMSTEDVIINVVYYENPKLLEGQCGEDIQWNLYADGSLVFRGTGAMSDYTAGGAPWAAEAAQVKQVYIDSRITTIGAYAFENCENLTFVDYGYRISGVGAYAFLGCKALKSLKLPQTMTVISEGAFYGCVSLQAVVIPDNITAIEENAFTGCSELVQVTIGGKVTAVGENAFADCAKLTQIYFRGTPAQLGENALGSTNGKFVYYYSTLSGWEEQIADGLWNGYRAIPYNAISKENFDGTNVYIIKVVDKHNLPLEDAVVTLGSTVQPTNRDGMAYFVKPSGAVSLSISCSDHITFTDSVFQASATQLMDVIELSDRPSVVQGVRVNWNSIATSVRVINCATEETLQITVSGYSKYTILKYELYQGNRLLTAVDTDATGCTFTVKANAFEEGQTVLVKMHTSDGQTVASALNIDVIKLATISEQQILSELSQLELSIGLGSMGNYKIPISFAAKGEEKIYTTISGRTIRVGINLDIDAFKEKDDEKAKTALHKMVDKSMRNFAKGKPGMEYNLCGYVEIEYLGNGEYYVKTSYVKVGIAATLAFRAQASYLGIVGVYFKASLTGASTLALKISRFEPESGFGVDDLNFEVENTLAIEGGAYLLWGIGSAGLYGRARMGFELGVIPDVEFRSVYITGEFGARWSALWGLYSDSCVIAAGDIYRWPDSHAAKRLAEKLYALQQDPDSYKLNDRAYLENRSQWLSGEYLQKNIYHNVAPRIVTCGDTTMMLWLDDNASRDAANFQTLYYSVYNNGSWSTPAALDDNGTFDCEFDVYTADGKIYVVYTEMAAQNPQIATLDLADDSAVTAFAGGVEVFAAVYENGGFGAPTQLTENTACELLPRIAVADGKVRASWVQTEMVTVSGQTGNNTLQSAVLDTAGWSDPTVYVGGQNAVSDLATVTLGNASYTVYLVDADGIGETKDDQTLVLGDAAGEMTTLDTGLIANVTCGSIGEKKVLTWHNNGGIYMITQPGQTPVSLLPEGVTAGANYEIVSISEGKTLLTFVMNNYDLQGNAYDGTDIYGVYIQENGYITDPVRLTQTEGYVTNYSAVYDKKLIVVLTESIATVAEDTVETVTHLKTTAIDFVTDLSLVAVDHDPTVAQPNGEYALELQLRNNGMQPIDGVVVRLCDAQGQMLYTADCEAQLNPGAAGELTATVVLPAQFTTDGYSIQVLPGNATDANLEDNSQKADITYADFAVVAEQKIIGEKSHIALTVSNIGNMPAEATIAVYAPDADGRKLTELKTAKIAPGEKEQYFVELSAFLRADENHVTCAVVCEDDPYPLNNNQMLTLLHIDDSAFAADPEQVMPNPEISANALVYDKYAPEDITVTITAEAQRFTGVEGLTAGTDYTLAGSKLTIQGAFLSGLEIGTHSLNLVFDFGYDAPVVRTVSVTVTDSTPKALSGEIAISGDVAAGSTVYADVSGLKPDTARLTYQWTVNGVVVSNLAFYEIREQDIGKALKLTVCGVSGYSGEFSAEKTVAAKLQDAPAAPVISKIDSFSFTVVKTEGVDYSIDLQTWQTSNVFSGLTPNTTYTVYARKAATQTAAASAASSGVSVTTPKATVQAPAAPEILTVGDTSVQLVQVDGVEYSMDKQTWQQSGLFEGLSPNRVYAFYARKAQTQTTHPSASSGATVVTTKKSTVSAPAAPVVVLRSDTTVTLQWHEGYEYSMDGVTWQNEQNADWYGCNRFVDLSPNTYYTFYQRIAQTDTTYASASSEPLKIRTWKTTVGAPPKPVVAEILPDGIILQANENYQYKLEPYTGAFVVEVPVIGNTWGTEEEPTVSENGWQDSNVFTGLQPNTKYVCYQRYKGTDTAYASYSSRHTEVTTIKYAQTAPESPAVISCTDTIVTLAQTSGMEYSMDGATWQESGVFAGLLPNRAYNFYGRWKETQTAYASPASVATTVRTLRSDTQAPDAPQVVTVGDKTVQLLQIDGLEYSLNQVNWQSSGLFENLQPNCQYAFYARKAQTDTTNASPASVATQVTTKKTTVGQATCPDVLTVGDTSVQLVERSGYEYSMDKQTWQQSGLFEGLSPNREYSFYTRKAETDTAYASMPSAATVVTTRKSAAKAPAAPTVEQISYMAVTLQQHEGYEYSSDGVIWQESNVFADLQPNTEYTFYQRTKETETVYASPASAALTVRTLRKPMVEALIDGKPVQYPSLTEAMAQVPAYTTVQLLEDMTEAIAVNKELILDLNGFDLTGDITVMSEGALWVKDSQTDDYTVMDEAGYGKLIGTVAGVRAADGYMMIMQGEGVSFHRIDLNVHTMTLRASVAGVYFRSEFAGDEIVAQNVERYGVAFSITETPTAENMGICSWYDSFTAGSGGNAANGTLLRGIMKKTNSEAENQSNAQTLVYGRPYLLTKDGQYILGDVVSRSLQQQVELADDQWDTLTAEQKNAVLTMCRDYQTVVENWDIPNILAEQQ